MLVFTSRSDEAPEESVFDLFMSTEGERRNPASPWVGHPFRVRTAMRDGSTVSLAFTVAECAEILLLLGNDLAIRSWLDTRPGVETDRKLN